MALILIREVPAVLSEAEPIPVSILQLCLRKLAFLASHWTPSCLMVLALSCKV